MMPVFIETGEAWSIGGPRGNEKHMMVKVVMSAQ